MKKVAILAYEGCWGMSLFSAADFFRIVSLLEKHVGLAPSFDVQILSPDGSTVTAAGGHRIQPDGRLADYTDLDLIILPALEGPRLLQGIAPESPVLNWLRQRIHAGSSVLALTTAAAWLAASDLFSGILMATHWAYVPVLAKHYPQCRFMAHPSFLHSNRIYTTGSLNGSFDALLEIVAQEHGNRFAQLCATHLLLAQPARLSPILPGHRNHGDEAILKLQDWIESNFYDPLTLQQMARQIHLSERTLKRRFAKATTLAPNRYLQLVRVDKAKKLLISTSLSIQQVAAEVGYENVSFFVRVFKNVVGQTPGRWKSGGVDTPAAHH